MPRSALKVVLLLPPILIVTALASRVQTPVQPVSNTFILGQAICLPASPAPPQPQLPECAPQHAPVGAIIEIQLPGTPSVWTVSKVSSNLTALGKPSRLHSPGRIEGTSEVYRFQFSVVSTGTGRIEMTEKPRFLANTSGVFTYSILVP
jgi:hypothetical protein